MGEKLGETAGHGSQINILLCQIVTHYSRNMWSSVVLLKWDVVGLSVYRRVGERYADACVIQRQSFGGGSVMVWGGIAAHGRTPLVVVAGNLTGIRYRDERPSLLSW
jgi:hypothetical protein